MRVSDWSSDVCSSDLPFPWHRHNQAPLYGLRELSNKSRRRPHPAGAPTPGSIIRPIMAKTPSSDQNQFANKAQAWSARFSEPVSELVKRYTASVDFDQRLARHDIQGSLAHAEMLAAQGIIPAQDLADIQRGMAQILAEDRKSTRLNSSH